MGLLSRKYKPVAVPLPRPSLQHLPLPDMTVMRKHMDRVLMTNDVCLQEAQSPAIREFSRELAVALFDAYATRLCGDHDRLMGGVGLAVCLGMGYSGIDDGMSIPKGMTEQCTLVALTMGSGFLSELPASWQHPLFYAVQAGHYMGRKGRSTMPELISRVEDNRA